MADEKRLIDANAPTVKEYFNPRLIDYREFVKECNHFYENPPFPNPATPWHKGLQLAVEIAMRLPTVDAVEVVRCKDCLYSYRLDPPVERYDCRKSTRFGMSMWMGSDDFCSYGERKDNEITE